PLALAGRTGAGDGEEPLGVAHLAAASAVLADGRRRAAGAAVPLALGAGLQARDSQRRLGAEGRLLKGESEVVAQVGAAGHPRRTAAATAAAAEAEEVAQDVREVG